MGDIWWVFAVGGAILVAIFAVIVYERSPGRRKQRAAALLDEARQSFQHRREWLEARFLTLAQQRGLPRGLRWSNCEFEDDVAFARNRKSGLPRALVGVTISFEAIPGGGMEEVEAVSNLRAATVVFRFDGQTWETDGIACFNLSPTEAIDYYKHELETAD